MAGIQPRFPTGGNYRTYAVSEAIAGGQVVAADQSATTVDTVSIASTGSELVLGVALNDAAPAGTDAVTDAAARQPLVTVYSDGEVPVKFQAAAQLGDPLRVGANGTVLGVVDDSGELDTIGHCRSAAVTAGGVGYAYIHASG